jgi:predicted nucleic acid-binding Zn ribbon protein
MVVDDKQTNNEELLQLAIRAAKGGNRDGARVMLRQVYGRDRHNETAMLWLAKLANNDPERQQWLNRVLDVNPDNKTAKTGLEKIEYKQQASDNRTIAMYGIIAVIMLVIVIFIVGLVLVI